VAEDARYDGLYVLRTNLPMHPLNVMLRYRDLLVVEQLFRPKRNGARNHAAWANGASTPRSGLNPVGPMAVFASQR
jgi:hypothetical protein